MTPPDFARMLTECGIEPTPVAVHLLRSVHAQGREAGVREAAEVAEAEAREYEPDGHCTQVVRGVRERILSLLGATKGG